MRAVRLFRAWTDEVGVTVGARLVGCDITYASHLRAGRKAPGLALAVRIEEATRGWHRGPIAPRDWVRAGCTRAA